MIAVDTSALMAIILDEPQAASCIAEAYGRWGRGIHPAGLNLGDCFAYEVAK